MAGGGNDSLLDHPDLKEKHPMNRIPPCEVVAAMAGTTVLEVPRRSIAADLLRSTGMANALMSCDVAVFNRKALMKKWL